MLATLIPLFDNNSEVRAYSLFAQRENKLLSPLYMGTGAYDGAVNIPGFDIIDNIGIENLSGNRDVFIEVTQFSIFSDLEKNSKVPVKSVVLLIDSRVEPTEPFLNRIDDLRKKGFRFALRKLPMDQFANYAAILSRVNYILLNHKKVNVNRAKEIFNKAYPRIKLIAVSVDTKEDYANLSREGMFDLYEGDFFRTPVKGSGKELSPMKITYLELLRIINAPNFDLTDVAKIIEHDTALVISLLRIANRMSINSEITSIQHATAMLGQKELKKWIDSAVTRELCVDKPSEIIRVSLIRARFAENLAGQFGLANKKPELFLMGLFSVIDIILDKPMAEALGLIGLSKEIQDALVNNTGELYPVINFIKEYEHASWQEISRLIILNNMSMEEIYKGYVDSLAWFKQIFEE